MITPSSNNSRRGSTKISLRYGNNTVNNVNSSTIEELSPELNLILLILNIWIKDLRSLCHRQSSLKTGTEIEAETEEEKEGEEGFGKILIAIIQLLGEKNEKLLRSYSTDLLLALNRSEVEEVGMARDSIFEIYAYVFLPSIYSITYIMMLLLILMLIDWLIDYNVEFRLQVTYGICRHVLDWNEDRKALELLIQDLMRYQAFFQGASVGLPFFLSLHYLTNSYFYRTNKLNHY